MLVTVAGIFVAVSRIPAAITGTIPAFLPFLIEVDLAKVSRPASTIAVNLVETNYELDGQIQCH